MAKLTFSSTTQLVSDTFRRFVLFRMRFNAQDAILPQAALNSLSRKVQFKASRFLLVLL